MQSDKYYIEKAKKQKKIAVIGGGIGGMEAAIVSAKRGHTVTLYEKSDKLGGVFIAAAAPSFKEKDKALIAWYEREIRKYPEIEIKLNTEVKDTKELGADEVIVATGAKARKLPIKGIEHSVEAIDHLLGRKAAGDKVVVIGGGLTGCEIAYQLSLEGKEVSIVEMKNDLIVSDKICLANTSYLRDYFKLNGTPVYLESSVSEIREDGVTVKSKDGTLTELACDSVIVCAGYTPAPIADKGVHVIGDAKQVGSLRTVIWQAWDVAMKL